MTAATTDELRAMLTDYYNLPTIGARPMATEREAKPGKHVLPEFVKVTRVGQTVGGKIKKFDTNENGDFVTLEPVVIRAKPGADWLLYGTAAFGIGADIARKIDKAQDVGQFVLFQFVDEEATKKGSKKKVFKVLILDAPEIQALMKRALDKTAERAATIERSGGSVVPPLFPEA